MSKVSILMQSACSILAALLGMAGPITFPAVGAEQEYFGMPVYVESRRLPELPQRPSQVRDAEVPRGKRLRAGAARVDVTPSGPVTMCGFQARQSTGVHDRLYVRAIVLDNGGRLPGHPQLAEVKSHIVIKPSTSRRYRSDFVQEKSSKEEFT